MRKRTSNRRFCVFAFLTLLFPVSYAGQTFFSDSNRGWFFYESKPQEEYESYVLLNTKSQTPGEKAESELAQLQQNLHQAQALALMYPTPENVWSYQELKTKIQNMAGVLTDQQMRNQWERPDSYSANNATGGEGLEIDRAALNHCSDDMIRTANGIYGMFLFVSKSCKYCDAQIKILQTAKQRYGLQSLVIGFDGYKPNNLAGLQYRSDNGMSKQMGVVNDSKPAMVMLNSTTGKTQVLGYGYVPIDNLSSRICRFYTKQLGEY